MKRFLALFLLALGYLSAADHYIWSGASGAGTGADWTNAWTAIGSHVTVRGDTYYIAGGTYNESPSLGSSLSGATVITLKKANAADNSGVAGWQSSFASTQAVINGTLAVNYGYVTVDGVTGSGFSGHGIKVYNASLSNVVTLDNASNFVLAHLEVRGAGTAAGATPFVGINWNNIAAAKKGTYIHHCWIHETTTIGVQVLNAVGTSYSDYGFKYQYNVISETGLCTDPDNHGHAISLGQASEIGFCIVDGNYFRNIAGSGVVVFLTSGNNSVHHDIEVTNNVIYLTDLINYTIISPGVVWQEGIKGFTNCTLDRLLIANNTIYNVTGTNNLAQFVLEISTSSIVSENNIFEGCHFSATSTGLTTDTNNGYYNNNGTTPGGTAKINGSATTFIDATTANFGLVVGGYAVGSGLDLSATFTTDAAGTTRNAPWDLGAYAYGSSTGGSSSGGSLILGGSASLK